MKIHQLCKKTAIIFLCTLVALATLLYATSHFILLKDFSNLEQQLVIENVQRVIHALDTEADAMRRVLGDWCAWTDTLEFIKGNYPEYVENNLMGDTFSNLDLDLMLLTDQAGNLRWTGAYNYETGNMTPASNVIIQQVLENQHLMVHPDADSRVSGVFRTAAATYMIASGPIVDSDSKGPIGGTMIMARQLDKQDIKTIGDRTRLSLTAEDVPYNIKKALEKNTDTPYITTGPIMVIAENDNSILGHVVIADIEGYPAKRLIARMPRRVYNQGQATTGYFMVWLAASGLLIFFLAMFALRTVIISPIGSLNSQVTAIAAQSNFSQRVATSGKDEISELSNGINKMLDALDHANLEVKEAYEQMKSTQSQLVQSAKLASIGSLAAGVAHELNQPLMVIRGNAQLMHRCLANGTLDNLDMGDQLQRLVHNTKRMMKIINHLRDFSRQSNLDLLPLDINKVIEDCFLMLGEQLRIKSIAVELKLSDRLPQVLGDSNQLEQVLLNLITNARDAIMEDNNHHQNHTKPALSGQPKRIGLSTQYLPSPDNRVEVMVEDNGPGIPNENIEQIFDPFFTTKEVGKGTGLGLSISYGIIEDHGGTLQVKKTGGTGTSFSIQLPIA